MKQAYILGSNRIPFTKSISHYFGISPQELMKGSLRGLVDRYHLSNVQLGDVALGAKLFGEIDLTKMNTKGGSHAVGHPFAATGSRILNSAAHILKSKKRRSLFDFSSYGWRDGRG